MRSRSPLLRWFLALGTLCGATALADDGPARPTDNYMYRDAMYYHVSESRENKPWLDIAIHGYVREYKASGSQKRATEVFNALADLGTKREALHRSGSSWAEDRTKDHDALKKEFFATIKSYGSAGGGSTAATTFKVATDAVSLMDSQLTERAKRRGPSDDMRWETYAASGESARAYAEKRKGMADNFGQSRALAGRYSADQYMSATALLDRNALGGLAGLLEAHTGFKAGATIDELKKNMPAWAAAVDAGSNGRLLNAVADRQAVNHSETSDRLRRLGGRLSAVELGVRVNGELITAATEKIEALREAMEKARAELAEEAKKTEKRLSDLDQLLRDRFNEEDRRRALEAERARLAQIARQKFEEKLGAFDSASNLFKHIATLVPDKEMQKALGQLAGLAQLSKQFEQLRSTQPISRFGKAALTMDWISLGIQFTTLALGIGGGPNPDQMVLEAVLKLSRQMHERFDRLELVLADLQRSMNRHFHDVHTTLDRIHDGVRDANLRLIALQENVARLERSVDFYGKSVLAAQSANEWQVLRDTESEFVTRRPHPLGDPRELARGARKFVELGAEHSRLPSIIGFDEAFEPGLGARELLKRLEAIPRPSEKLNAFLALEAALFAVPLPAEKPIPEEGFWSRAATNYLRLADENSSYALLPVTLEPGLRELHETGEEIRSALVAARRPDRLDAVLEGVGRSYQRALAILHDLWTSAALRSALGLSRSPAALHALFNPTGGAEADLKARMAERISPKTGFTQGKILFKTSNGEYRPVEGGWGIIHPAMRAIAHFGAQLKPGGSPSPDDYVIHVSVDDKNAIAKFGEKIDENSYWTYPKLTLRIQFPKMGPPLFVDFSHDELRYRTVPTYGKRPKKQPSKEFDIWRATYDLWVFEEQHRIRSFATDKLAGDWDRLVADFARQSPNPWPLSYGARTTELAKVMLGRAEGTIQELQQLMTRDRTKPVHFAKARPSPYAEGLYLWYVEPELGKAFDGAVEELEARQQVLQRHLIRFAPDFLFARGEDIGPWLRENTWGPDVLTRASADFYWQVASGDGKLAHERENLVGKDWEAPTVPAPMGTHHGRRLKESYREYLASLPKGVQPPCMRVDAVLDQLADRVAAARTVKAVLEHAKALSRTYAVEYD